MNPEDHQLMILMFARLQAQIRALANILQREAIMTQEDFARFDFAAIQPDPSNSAAFVQLGEQYLEFAKAVGISGEKLPKAGPKSH